MAHEKNERIRAYLNQEMTPQEVRAFEAELETDPSLRDELRLFRLLGKATEVYGRQHLRAIAAEVRQEIGPLPTPQLTILDRMRFLAYSSLYKWIALGTITFLVALIALNVVYCPPSRLISSAFPPADPNQASLTAEEYAHYQLAARYYNSNERDALTALAADTPGFSMADYYLAHYYLAQHDYVRARALLSQTLENEAVLAKSPQTRDMGRIKYNLLLARLGAEGNSDAIRKSIGEYLDNDPDFVGETREKAEQLLLDLQNPARCLCVN
ncbi:MAG TPA: hypothetical protein PK228_19395 [Saprospiraceae bacterium]|nr:hypothetical protein [Saprospiraceae bacterium]